VEGKDSIRGDEENMSIMSIGRVDGHEVGDNARLLRWRYRQISMNSLYPSAEL